MSQASSKISVSDPFGAVKDPALPALKLALDPYEAKEEFKRRLPRLAGEDGLVLLRAMRVIRHKPGKRCVIEYDVKVEREGLRSETITLIGKVRARRYGNEALRLQELIWNAGFQADSSDGISVPEPIGVLPKLQVWLQRKVPGRVTSELLGGSDGIAIARRIAKAIHKLHRAGVPTERTHTMADELRILHEHLPLVTETKPHLGKRIERVLAACDQLGATLSAPKACGIHRDFYPAQVIVDGARLYLLDFDLYCQGDPGLDIGNFLGHMIEQSVRDFGDAAALADRERALEERFVELSGEETRQAIQVYTTLTLVRHIYLSTRFEDRLPFTERFLQLCEQRLGM
jgi:hypothetical protein